MTWQDDLRRLEDDLVNGRVSAEEYRKRRDQLLSSANTTGQAEAPSAAENTQIIPPVPAAPQQPQQQPQPPQQADPDRTQAVSSRSFGHQPDSDADATQVVGGYGHQGQQQNEEPPPWQGNEFPPLVSGSSDWVKQGPEVFGGSSAEKKPSKGKIFGVIGAVVVVLLLIVGGIFLFTGGDDKGNDSANPPQSNSQQNSEQVLGIADPPGQAESHTEVTDLTTMKKANYLNPSEVQAYADAVVTKVVFKVGKPDDGNTVAAVGAQAGSTEGAKSAAKKLSNIQILNNMTAQKDAPQNVYLAGLPKKPGGPVEFRAHWAHDTTIVRVSATGKDYDAVKRDFQQAVDAQLKATPANG